MTALKWVIALTGVVAVGAGAALYASFGAFLPWRERAEAARIAELAGLRSGDTVAEIGAGRGRFSLELAGRVGPNGRVFATELQGSDALSSLTTSVRGVDNITVIAAERTTTHLPDGCCDVLLLRNVYHHVGDPAALIAQLNRALRAGGRVVVIDFAPDALWFHGGTPADAAARRSGHGVALNAATEEFTAAGFHVDRAIPEWSGPMWLALFTKRAATTTRSSAFDRRSAPLTSRPE